MDAVVTVLYSRISSQHTHFHVSLLPISSHLLRKTSQNGFTELVVIDGGSLGDFAQARRVAATTRPAALSSLSLAPLLELDSHLRAVGEKACRLLHWCAFFGGLSEYALVANHPSYSCHSPYFLDAWLGP